MPNSSWQCETHLTFSFRKLSMSMATAATTTRTTTTNKTSSLPNYTQKQEHKLHKGNGKFCAKSWSFISLDPCFSSPSPSLEPTRKFIFNSIKVVEAHELQLSANMAKSTIRVCIESEPKIMKHCQTDWLPDSQLDRLPVRAS